MAPRCIEAARGPIDAAFRALPSKSATHRVLVAAALAEGDSEIFRPLDSDDTRRTREGLTALGIDIRCDGETWTVHGRGGLIPGGGTVDLGASGTSARFLTAIAALGVAASTLDGVPRLRERPLAELVEALGRLGAAVEALGGAGLPIRAGGQAVRGGSVEIAGSRSSQFASALLLAACAFDDGLRLTIAPPVVSSGYVAMTLATLEAFGASFARGATIEVPPQRLVAGRHAVEGDHSSASYLFAAAALVGGTVRVAGIDRGSLQPDARFLRDLEGLGCEVRDEPGATVVRGSGRIPAFAWELADAPDLAPTACALAVHADGPCRLSGLGHLRLKESDRLAMLADNARRIGARAIVDGDVLEVHPRARGRSSEVAVEVAGDHRIAMAFALAGLRDGGVVLSDADVVAKSYPSFWEDFERLRA